MKIKINHQVFEYSLRDQWISPLKELIGSRVVADNRAKLDIDLFVFEENSPLDSEGKLPLNIMNLSLVDAWVIQYRSGVGSFEAYPDTLSETDVIQIVDEYCKDFARFQSRFQWKQIKSFGFGSSTAVNVLLTIIFLAAIGLTVVYFLIKNGVISIQ